VRDSTLNVYISVILILWHLHTFNMAIFKHDSLEVYEMVTFE